MSTFYFDFCTEGGICLRSTLTYVQTRGICRHSTLTSAFPIILFYFEIC